MTFHLAHESPRVALAGEILQDGTGLGILVLGPRDAHHQSPAQDRKKQGCGSGFALI